MLKGWLKYLSEDVYNRLCNCTSKKSDLPELCKAKWRAYKDAGKDQHGFTEEDAIVAVLEHLDCNGCCYDLTNDEYEELKKSL